MGGEEAGGGLHYVPGGRQIQRGCLSVLKREEAGEAEWVLHDYHGEEGHRGKLLFAELRLYFSAF